MAKYYFLDKDDGMCFTKDIVDIYMKSNKIEEVEVYVAEPYKIGGTEFWCKFYESMGGDPKNCCGIKICKDYSPKNKKSGACVHYTKTFYRPSTKVILRLNKK